MDELAKQVIEALGGNAVSVILSTIAKLVQALAALGEDVPELEKACKAAAERVTARQKANEDAARRAMGLG